MKSGPEVNSRRVPPSLRLSCQLGMWAMLWVQVGCGAGSRSLSLRTDPCSKRPSISVSKGRSFWSETS